jgi:prefoldin alpha subunit
MSEKQMHMHMLQKSAMQVQQHLQELDGQLEQLAHVAEGLGDFGKLTAGDEMLVPLASGIFAVAELKEKSLRVNVGAKVVVEKSADDTKKIILDQIKDLEKVQGNLQFQLEHFMAELKKNV